MKVVCIADEGWFETRKYFFKLFKINFDSIGPKYGEICTVVGEYYNDGELFYLIKEWPLDDKHGWQADGFAPLDEGFEAISLEKVMEEETKFVGVN